MFLDKNRGVFEIELRFVRFQSLVPEFDPKPETIPNESDPGEVLFDAWYYHIINVSGRVVTVNWITCFLRQLVPMWFWNTVSIQLFTSAFSTDLLATIKETQVSNQEDALIAKCKHSIAHYQDSTLMLDFGAVGFDQTTMMGKLWREVGMDLVRFEICEIFFRSTATRLHYCTLYCSLEKNLSLCSLDSSFQLSGRCVNEEVITQKKLSWWWSTLFPV